MTDSPDPRIAAWLAPIPGDAPGGIDARYEPAHEALRAEIGKLDSVTGGEVDWPLVRDSAGRLLAETSKDLLVSSYLTYALFQLEGKPGLAAGISTMAGLLRDYWETMFPPTPSCASAGQRHQLDDGAGRAVAHRRPGRPRGSPGGDGG